MNQCFQDHFVDFLAQALYATRAASGMFDCTEVDRTVYDLLLNRFPESVHMNMPHRLMTSRETNDAIRRTLSWPTSATE